MLSIMIVDDYGDEGESYYSMPMPSYKASQEPLQSSAPRQTAHNSNFPASPYMSTGTFQSPANSASNLTSGARTTNTSIELEDESYLIARQPSTGYSTAVPVILHNGHHLEVQVEEGYANAATIQRY